MRYPQASPSPSIRGWIETQYYRRIWQQEMMARQEYPAVRFKGRGLVFSVGGQRHFVNLWVNLCLLRRIHKCPLPIEIWHFGKNELTPEMTSLLKSFGVDVVDGEVFASDLPRGKWRGFALKTLSIIHSRFQEVLFLDADSYAVRDPSFLFDEWAYRWSGARFWPDIWSTNPKSAIWSILDIPFVDENEWESGQMVIDKSRAWRALSLVGHLNRHFPFYYQHVYGDKMTFYAAWKKLDQPYAMTQHAARLVAGNDSRFLLNQFDFQGSLLFQHRTTSDWKLLEGEDNGGPKFIHQEICEEFLEELRKKWPVAARNCSPNRAGSRERPSLGKSVQAILFAAPQSKTPLASSHRDEEKWDAIARQALTSPVSVSPRLMGTGIEALRNSDEKEARAILRFFAALIFIDPRLADMLPENLDAEGTTLQQPWASLKSFVKSISSSKRRENLLTVRGNLFSAGAPPNLKPEEKFLIKQLTAILSDPETSIWHEWQQFWEQTLTRQEEKPVPMNDATKSASHSSATLRPWRAQARPEKILVLTPLKDAADLAMDYCERLSRLNYPPELLSIGLLESDSQDGTYEVFDKALSNLKKHWRRVDLWKHDFDYKIPTGFLRWHADIQLKRREILARSRNELLSRSLKDEDWVLWLDADVIDYPRDIIEQLLSYGKDILHPHCVLDYGEQTFDRNAWRDKGRVHMESLRGRELLAPLDAVGGTMLLIRADLHRRGLIFPPLPYGRDNPRIRDSGACYDPANPGEVETEGLAIMASDMNVQCWGLPDLEIRHRNR